MGPERSAPGEAWMDEVIGRLLRAGVLIAGLVVLAGGALYLLRHGHERPAYGVFQGQPADLRSVSGVLADLPTLRARAIIQLGLLLLIATPVARVVFALAAFALQRDRTYVVVTSIVLLALLYGLFWGRL